MTETAKSDFCSLACWGISTVIGLFLVFNTVQELPAVGALMLGAGLVALLGIAMTRIVCMDRGFTENVGLAAGTKIDREPAADPVKSVPVPQLPPQTVARAEPDDLKQIKGIGPKLEQMLIEKGVTRFEQIARWSQENIAQMDEGLEGFRGRVSRDRWVEQAKDLVENSARQQKDGSQEIKQENNPKNQNRGT